MTAERGGDPRRISMEDQLAVGALQQETYYHVDRRATVRRVARCSALREVLRGQLTSGIPRAIQPGLRDGWQILIILAGSIECVASAPGLPGQIHCGAASFTKPRPSDEE